MADGGLVIFAGPRTWYASGKENLSSTPSPKRGKGVRKAIKSRVTTRPAGPVKYPLFLEASALTEDPYWMAILRDAATDRWPRGFRFTNSMLIFRSRNKNIEQMINTDSPSMALTIIRDFMQTQAGLFSQQDNEVKEREAKEAPPVTVINSWSQVKTTIHRTFLIVRFINEVTKREQLSPKDAQSLNRAVRVGILNEYFNGTTIHVEDGMIVKIDGLYRNALGEYDIDVSAVPLKRKKITVSPSPESPGEDEESRVLKNWSKFLMRRTR